MISFGSPRTETARKSPCACVAIAALLAPSVASAQNLTGADLVQALQGGGYVLVIRNARSPEEVPAERQRAPANLNGEREIDAYGQGQMSVIAYAFRELRIPIAYTLMSPAYRSRQSANYLGGFGKPRIVPELGEDAGGSLLAQRVAEAPPPGQNTVIVTHGSLIRRAFGRATREVGPAETLIYLPRNGSLELVARLTVEDWSKLAVE